MPILGDPGHQAMVDFMTRLPDQLRKPDAILVISAHWEENAATLLGAQNPEHVLRLLWFPGQSLRNHLPGPRKP